jgi:uncharacterized protein
MGIQNRFGPEPFTRTALAHSVVGSDQPLLFPTTAMLTGFIWAIWHYPVILFADYDGAAPAWFYVPLLTVMLPFLTFVWTWMRLNSKSLWPCVFLHASHNTFIQQFFDPLTIYRSKTGYVAGKFGVAITMSCVCSGSE